MGSKTVETDIWIAEPKSYGRASAPTRHYVMTEVGDYDYDSIHKLIRKPDIHVKIHVRFVEKGLQKPQIEKTAKNEQNPSRNSEMRAILGFSQKSGSHRQFLKNNVTT